MESMLCDNKVYSEPNLSRNTLKRDIWGLQCLKKIGMAIWSGAEKLD